MVSQAWNDSLYIAMNSGTQDNPIGKNLWFATTKYYRPVVKDGVEYYDWGMEPKRVLENEKVTIGNHIFWRVEGYDF